MTNPADRLHDYELEIPALKPDQRIAPLDCSGKLPDGRAFAGLDEFAQLLGDQQPPSRYRFGEVLTRRLTGYALNRPLNLSDEELIRSLVQSAQRNGWRVREIIKSIVLADSFTQG